MLAYANQDDVEAILPDEDSVPEEAVERLEVNLQEATDLVIGFLGREYTDDPIGGVPGDVPGAVRRVTARVALRAFVDIPENPGAEAETNLMGPFSHTINWSKEAQSRDFYLTDSDELRMKKYQLASSRGAYHAPMYDDSAPACGWHCG